ncbi:ATP-binding protein [Labilibacter marinus]|uniref:ATP-binding protein n=1 Tax=Labilibacter marinus TaxID=1477105 RepID=UPI00094FE703|nr:ATP-binding protein [Labilibacter marinus]
MSDCEEEKIKYHELLERVKSLEEENDSLAERAEEILLLSMLGDTISSIDNEKQLIEELLEKISILNNISLCCCYEIIEGKYHLYSGYISDPYINEIAPEIKLGNEILEEICNAQMYCGLATEGKGLVYPTHVTDNTEILIVYFNGRQVKEGVFVFMDEKNGHTLHTKLMVVRQAIRMVVARIENLSYIAEIEELNRDLEEKVLKRTIELTKARDKAQESDRLKSAFLANMSHEIRTPMNAIVGFSELLESKSCDSTEIENYASLIYSNSLSLLNLINDLLDFSKIEANQLQLHCLSFNIHDTIKEVEMLTRSLIRQYDKPDLSVKVVNEVGSKITSLHTDELRLKQILTNLLSNAVKFSFKGIIYIKYELKGSQIWFSIKDEGIGIDDGLHEMIFSRFSRVTDDVNKTIAGNGLGLTITKNLVKLLGGRITVNSKLGYGSEFSFCVDVNHCNKV